MSEKTASKGLPDEKRIEYINFIINLLYLSNFKMALNCSFVKNSILLATKMGVFFMSFQTVY